MGLIAGTLACCISSKRLGAMVSALGGKATAIGTWLA